MKPVLALIGRPNVGKSTLFNRLTRSRDALVADFPGLTRDRKYGTGELNGRSYMLIDTGGLSGEEVGIDEHMAKQTRAAMQEADAILFIVDGKQGLTAADQQIAQDIRIMGSGGQTLLAIDDEQDSIGFLHRRAGLFRHVFVDADFFTAQTAGVDQHVAAPVEFASAVFAVTSQAGEIRHQRIT